MGGGGPAFAHQGADEGRPVSGLQLGAAVALGWGQAEAPLPSGRLPGVLGRGGGEVDRRGGGVEHAAVSAGWGIAPWLAGRFALGWHGEGAAHVESLWLAAQAVGEAGRFGAGLGRDRVPLGPVLAEAGHFDRFGLMPLAKRMAFEGDWIEEGVNLAWRSAPQGPVRIEFDVGLWRGEAFPAGEGDWGPVLHGGLLWQGMRLDGFMARFDGIGRGGAVRRGAADHRHGGLDCDARSADVSCFEGRSSLGGLSLAWADPHSPLDAQAAFVARREHGALSSVNGATRYRGHSRAGWLTVGWRFAEDWRAAVRHERALGRHTLAGVGAEAVARDTGLLPNEGASVRSAASLDWALRDDTRLLAEAGQERIGGERNAYLLLRVLWRWQHGG